MALVDTPIRDFLEQLASPAPTPGGGSVAALVGALAASLGRMVSAFTVGRPKFAAVEPQVRSLAERLARADALFRRLIDEDAAAYEVLSAALRLEKTDPQRPVQVAQAAQLAATVPLETAALAASALRDLEALRAIGNPLLASDAEAAVHLARAAVHAATANVRANLPLLRPEDAQMVQRQLEAFPRP
ncbi:MAG: cyclodeaminase/cyclohydrolase family protein [Planctomycetota bacterium]